MSSPVLRGGVQGRAFRLHVWRQWPSFAQEPRPLRWPLRSGSFELGAVGCHRPGRRESDRSTEAERSRERPRSRIDATEAEVQRTRPRCRGGDTPSRDGPRAPGDPGRRAQGLGASRLSAAFACVPPRARACRPGRVRALLPADREEFPFRVGPLGPVGRRHRRNGCSSDSSASLELTQKGAAAELTPRCGHARAAGRLAARAAARAAGRRAARAAGRLAARARGTVGGRGGGGPGGGGLRRR